MKQGKPEFVGGWQYAGELPGQHRWPNIKTIISAADLWTYLLKEFLSPDPLLNPTALYEDSKSLVEQLLIPFDQLGYGLGIVDEYPYRTLIINTGPGITFGVDQETQEGVLMAKVDGQTVGFNDEGELIAAGGGEGVVIKPDGGLAFFEDGLGIVKGPGLTITVDEDSGIGILMAWPDMSSVGFTEEGKLAIQKDLLSDILSTIGQVAQIISDIADIVENVAKIGETVEGIITSLTALGASVAAIEGGIAAMIAAAGSAAGDVFSGLGDIIKAFTGSDGKIDTGAIKSLGTDVKNLKERMDKLDKNSTGNDRGLVYKLQDRIDNTDENLDRLYFSDSGQPLGALQRREYAAQYFDHANPPVEHTVTYELEFLPIAPRWWSWMEPNDAPSPPVAQLGSLMVDNFLLMDGVGEYTATDGSTYWAIKFKWDEEGISTFYKQLKTLLQYYVDGDLTWTDDGGNEHHVLWDHVEKQPVVISKLIDMLTSNFFTITASLDTSHNPVINSSWNDTGLTTFYSQIQQNKATIEDLQAEVDSLIAALTPDLEDLVNDIYQFTLNNRRHIEHNAQVLDKLIEKVNNLVASLTSDLEDLVNDIYQFVLNNRRHIEHNARELEKEIIKRDKQIEALMTAVSALAEKTGTDLGDIPDLVQYGLI